MNIFRGLKSEHDADIGQNSHSMGGHELAIYKRTLIHYTPRL
jgi:hypothetical protein